MLLYVKTKFSQHVLCIIPGTLLLRELKYSIKIKISSRELVSLGTAVVANREVQATSAS